MNEENVQFLKDRLFFLGFGDNLHAEMEKKIKAQHEKFTLPVQGEFGQGDQKKVVDYTLDFSRSKQQGSDMYFVNNYTAKLLDPNAENEKSQKFFLNKGTGVTAKEAFNLLEGRAVYKNKLVNKDGEEYSAWLQMNFKEKDKYDNYKVNQYHDAWKYDLEKSLRKHPIKELQSEEQKAELLKNLKKGNLQAVTFLKDGNEVKMFVEASPKERNVNVYDEKMNKQFQGIKVAKEGKEQSAQQTAGNNTSKSPAQDGDVGRGADEKHEAGHEKSKAEKQGKQLPPPEKTRKRKGMSV